ncbi:hypothetical protein OMP38_25500 [Cohnella ginsengisoli]|uniref:Uncharacterized protein n=1 Tax=Cohnella ginsengisoli TaxID=425004 RepID=A0A9X4QPE2_9BACL|nr:hypothetical protein [Cohnella ginsengisoli]MDG0793803.1 hypothetical protein [Cohnella ginsengisoli]
MNFDRLSKSSTQTPPQREAQSRSVRSESAGMKSARPLLQQAVGNRGLLGMLRDAGAMASSESSGQVGTEPVVQGKFVTETGGEDKKEEERIGQLLRTFMAWKRDDTDMMALYEPVLKDFEANQTSDDPVSLAGWTANHSGALTAAEEMLRMRSADSLQVGMEIEDDAKDAPQKRKPEQSEQRQNKKKRKLETKAKTKYSSEVEDSSDDETTELDAKQKLNILINLTASNMGILRSSGLDTKKAEHRFDEPLHRKIYAADRSLPEPKIADLTTQDYYSIGEQKLRLGKGRGHFIQAGGNAERGKTIKEPPAEYNKMIEAMLKMAKDPSAASLYKLATGADLDDKEAFEDRELAAIMLYSLNHNVSNSHSVRSNLTEHLQKFVSVVGISELSRSFEAGGGKGETSEKKSEKNEKESVSGGYSAETLVKMMLRLVMDGKVASLQAVFYEGKGGMDSLFLGAPSAEHSGNQLGGATVLRDPLAYGDNLERQMRHTPDNKKAFKTLLNAVSSGSAPELKAMDDKEKERLKKEKQAQQTDTVRKLVRTIRNTKLPDHAFAMNEFINEPNGTLGNLSKRLNQLAKMFADNPSAIAQIKEGRKALAAKRKEAQSKTF